MSARGLVIDHYRSGLGGMTPARIPLREDQRIVQWRGVDHEMELDKNTGHIAIHAYERDQSGVRNRVVSKVYENATAHRMAREFRQSCIGRTLPSSDVVDVLIAALAQDIEGDVRKARRDDLTFSGQITGRQVAGIWHDESADLNMDYHYDQLRTLANEGSPVRKPNSNQEAAALEALPEFGTF